MNIKSLPVLSVMEYIATDLTLSVFYSAKSKLLKSIALSNLGYINESF